MTDSKDREISELHSRIARLNDALRQAVIDAAEWARKAGEAQGKLEISEAAGILDGWMRDCERLRADKARLREALGSAIRNIENLTADIEAHKECAECQSNIEMYVEATDIYRAALQETSHDRD